METIYLDYNGTTPIAPEVAEAMLPYLQEIFGNPSSSHTFGEQAKKGLDAARKQVASLINCDPYEIIFTSGGTESNNYAIRGVAWANKDKGNHIITSAIEHPAVAAVCQCLAENGFEITTLPVDEFGLVNPADVENAITEKTILITIMHANNEIGTIQPIAEIAKIAKKHNILMHTDAAQSLGKIPVRIDELGVDLLSIAGHKLYAPKGVGALFIKRGVKLQNLLFGAGQERGLRPGTENMLEIAGLGKACELAKLNLEKNYENMKNTRDRLYKGLKENIDDFKLNGHPEKHLPNTLNISVAGVEANTLLAKMEGIAASAGAACHADTVELSATIRAIGVPKKLAKGTLRFTTGRYTTIEEIDRAVEIIANTVNELRA